MIKIMKSWKKCFQFNMKKNQVALQKENKKTRTIIYIYIMIESLHDSWLIVTTLLLILYYVIIYDRSNADFNNDFPQRCFLNVHRRCSYIPLINIKHA